MAIITWRVKKPKRATEEDFKGNVRKMLTTEMQSQFLRVQYNEMDT